MTEHVGRPTFRLPDEGARRYIGNAIESMRTYLRASGQLGDEGVVTPAMLDEAWVDLRASWKSSGGGAQPIKDAISQVGLSFGQVLVDRLGMEWVIATDTHGTDFAVRGDSGWIVYPRDVVRKRHDSDERGFLTALFHTIESGA